MRILLIHNQLWAHYKSILFEEIQRELTLSDPESTFLVAQIALYEASRATMQTNAKVTAFEYSYEVLYPRSLDSVTLWERVRGIFKTYHTVQPDVLTITGYYDWAQVLLLVYAKIRGKKVTISVESSQMDRTRNAGKELIKKLIFKLTDAFFCFGTSSVNYLLALGVPQAKIAVRQGAVVDNTRIRQRYDLARAVICPPGQPSRNFIYVGRMALEKNLLTLLEAFKEAIKNDRMADWGVILVGDGPERATLEDFVLKNELTQLVKFTGGVGWQEIPDYLAQADVLILPSFSEPWGLVVNEALVCGMPVIVSNKCGCAEDLVIAGANGFLFDPTDQENLVEIMQFYANHPAVINQHGAVSEKIILPFSPARVANEMISHYQNLAH
jgi:glycosyltransferase involved in cell wall biosynthesis